MLSKFQVLYSHNQPHVDFLPQLLLVTTRQAGERKAQWLALQHVLLIPLFSCIPFGLCFLFSTAASNFVQDIFKSFEKKGFPRIIVLHIFLIQPGVPNDNPNDN